MKLSTFKEIIDNFPHSEADAKTVDELVASWPDKTRRGLKRTLYRYIGELSYDDGENDDPSFDVSVIKKARNTDAEPDRQAARYYVDIDEVVKLFMTEPVALNLALSQSVLNETLVGDKAFGAGKTEEMAHMRLKAAKKHMQALASRVRVGPDGIFRLPATIDPALIRTVLEAFEKSKMLRIEYGGRNGKPETRDLHPLGLISKDGTLYLVASSFGQQEQPKSYALHRMKSARPSGALSTASAKFNLDDWLAGNGNLSHPDDRKGQCALELLVHADAAFHFRERPLGGGQIFAPAADKPDWWRLTVTIKHWHTLRSFLVSFGPNIEVVGPPDVRAEVAEWVKGMAMHYMADQDINKNTGSDEQLS